MNQTAVTITRAAAQADGFNMGWGLLRPLLCFNVILAHFWRPDPESMAMWQVPIYWLISFSVPIFMFWSFYFTSSKIDRGDGAYFRKRLWRVGWPFVAWGVIYFAVIWPLRVLTGYPAPHLSDLGWQLLTGHDAELNPSMWSQFVLFIFTVLFFLCMPRIRRGRGLILLALFALSIALQHTGANEAMFGGMRYELRYPLGRMAEILPFCLAGYAAGHYRVFEATRRHGAWIAPLFLCLAAVCIIPMQEHKMDGFGYVTAWYMPGALCLLAAMYHIPFGWMGPRMWNALKFLTSYTLGIYCMHRLAQPFVDKGVELLCPGLDSFWVCVLIYAGCFAAAHLIAKIPHKWAPQLVK